MSGGFFRGTSADQDTRFSNKQAKLMKSQKFPPELENLVDMTKVKIDVLKPWIAKRVTELIGFEDEVLINFIYGLLEGEAVNGKQVQISLTGFMERNTGKFMKELWTLLLSAQQNVSGVPQQFLDAKEEETKKKKAETDRIANEIHRKKEKEMQEFHEERAKMDGDGAKSRENHSELEPNVKHDARGSTIQQADEKERYKRNGRRRNSRGSRSPDSPYHSPSPRHKRAVSPSKSDSRSYSNDRRRSRSISGAPPSRSRSISSERRERSPPRRSMIHHRRHDVRRSPSPWRRPHLKRRSRSHSRRRSPSPVRYRVRSPRRHRSRSPLRRRSRSPVRRRSRSPVRRKSRTPIQRSPVQYKSRMPLRRRSPSPVHSRSPSPIRGRSPVHRRSPSPVHRRSRSPLRRHSPSPHHQSPPARRRYRRSLSNSPHQSMSPARRRPSMHGRKRSFSPVSRRSPVPQESSSPSHNRRSSISPVRKESPKRTRSPIQSPVERARHEKYSPAARRTSPSERAEVHSGNRKGTKSAERRPVVSLRSPQRDVKDQSDLGEKPRNLSPSLQKSPSGSDASRGRSYSEEQRSISPRDSPHKRRGRMVLPESPNPSRQAADPKTRRDNSGTVVDDENNLSSRDIGRYKNRSSGKSSLMPVRDKGSLETVDTYALADSTKSKEPQLTNSDRIHDTDHKEHRERLALSTITKTTDVSMKSREYHDAPRAKDKKIPRTDDDDKSGYQNLNAEGLPKLSRKSEQYNKNGSSDSPLKDADGHVDKVKEKRKQRKSDRQDAESDDFSSYDSHEDRKENKKRRREEKKLKKEMRRRRREEKRRRRGERRAEKQKLKSGDASSSSSDLEGDHSEDESVKRRELRASNFEETESEQKRLEIELREKALKSLRARKGSGN